jgi:hypothetical protein
VDVLIGVSPNREAACRRVGFPVPPRVALRAVIDTGSYVTGLTPAAFRALGIQPFRYVPVRTPSTRPGSPHLCDQYDVSLALLAGGSVYSFGSDHAIASDDFTPQEDVQGILGRDVLDRCVFTYYGPHRYFTLAF